MLFRQIRHATLILDYGETKILVDPMLAPPQTKPAFKLKSLFRKSNPLVALPDDADDYLSKVTHALITHCRRGHFDHLDRAGIEFLRQNQIPVYCSEDDAGYLKRRGLHVISLHKNQSHRFLNNGTIHLIPGRHGWGWISQVMANGVGYFIQLTNQPGIYLTGDTVLTREVRAAIETLRPDWLVLAAGGAQLDVGQPILMSKEEIFTAISLAPGKVLLNHLEALDHCPVSRAELTSMVVARGLADKVFIPPDGAVVCA
jgi:L-ascorbate metabolism protein UlaG (beta-lactamase superfamily)